MDETKFLKCITEENRRKILRFLGGRERCVYEIVAYMKKEQSVVSHHLASLRNCGLVSCRYDSRNVKYRIAHNEIVRFLADSRRISGAIKDRCKGKVCR